MGFPEVPRAPSEPLGRPSRRAATAAIKAHLQVMEGESLKGALSDALADGGNLGGQ
jgi:16S rRNA (cytosine967-C5)-methyltransferase